MLLFLQENATIVAKQATRQGIAEQVSEFCIKY